MSSTGSGGFLGDGGDGTVSIHQPVLLRESLEVMDLAPGMVVLDGTVGAGGHAAKFARAVSPGGTILGCDRDAEILRFATAALERERAAVESPQDGEDGGEPLRFELHHASFAELSRVVADFASARGNGGSAIDRVFLDLGVSSLQLDSPQRGFSFMHDGPLDMRLDQTATRSAAELLRTSSERELERILREYGEERFSRRIASAIVETRGRKPIERTQQLRDIVMRAMPGAAKRASRIDPATRTFQGIRIAVNDELGALERGLEAARSVLPVGGRLVVISFHSLEDRLVKRFMRSHFELPFRKPLRPTDAECRSNPRSRSARLRCGIQRGGDPAADKFARRRALRSEAQS